MTNVLLKSKKQMERDHGRGVYGRADSKNNVIEMRKDLSKGTARYVMKHEKEHLDKGEDGYLFGLDDALILGGSLVSGFLGSRSSGDAADAQRDASAAATAETRRQYDTNLRLLGPQIQTGDAARNVLASYYGLPQAQSGFRSNNALRGAASNVGNRGDFPRSPVPRGRAPYSPLVNDTSGITGVRPPAAPSGVEGHNNVLQSFFESPDYQFTLNRGLDAVNQNAAAGGGLRSGSTQKALLEFGSGMASQRLTDYLNGLRSLSGGSQTATNSAVNAGVNANAQINNNILRSGDAAASGYVNSAGAINNAVQGGISNFLLNRRLGGT